MDLRLGAVLPAAFYALSGMPIRKPLRAHALDRWADGTLLTAEDVLRLTVGRERIARYLKDVRGPLPHVKLMPTGGVSQENAAEFIRAGAVGVAAGSNLVDAVTVARGDWSTLTDRARALVEAVQGARS